MTLPELIKKHTKRKKIQRGMYKYTCKICFNTFLNAEEHFRWVHAEMIEDG